uniref:Uncharacterized protein n=1 Tax=Cacopsylla melanoneura TaxID=428564 RepID=A0A8D9E2W0_9HEMI
MGPVCSMLLSTWASLYLKCWQVLIPSCFALVKDWGPPWGRYWRALKSLYRPINNMKFPFIEVDVSNIQTNILVVSFRGKITADMFRRRLLKITDEEIAVLGRKNVCYIKVSSLAEHSIRIVLHLNVTVEDINLAIQKIEFVVKEFAIR